MSFFRQVAFAVGINYSDILLANSWDTVTGVNNLLIRDLILFGKRCKQINTIKQIAAGVLLAGLAVFGVLKGKSAVSKIKTMFNNLFRSSGSGSSRISAFFGSVKQGVVKAFKAVGTFFKNVWNKLFSRTP